MIKTKDEIMLNIRNILGESTDDNSINLIEDIADTFDDYENKVKGDGMDWKAEAERIDKEWRQKYRDRFFNSGSQSDPEPDDIFPEEQKPLKFEDLFKEG